MKKKSRILIYPLVMMGVFLMLTSSCKKNPTVPVLTTSAVSNIGSNTTSCGGNITSDGGTTVTARGVCWSTGQSPTIADSKTTDGAGAGSFTSAITGLAANTTYYVLAYATNSAGTGYGSATSFTTQQIVTDIDGNVYHVVTIGTQVWLVENLKTTHYRDGTAIPNVTDATTWGNLTTGAYCDYNNIPSNSDIYGRLYNWYAATGSHNICPTGWHVPSDAEWTTLITFLGGESIAGGKLKETGTIHWQSPNTGATNETGFSALPGGYCWQWTIWRRWGYGLWWSSTENGTDGAWSRLMGCDDGGVGRNYSNSSVGLSVRCLKD